MKWLAGQINALHWQCPNPLKLMLQLGLVAKALLVAISLHALFTLMFADFRLTTFF